MSLTAGARLGPYEVVAAIGAGGIGEVYRARDTRLGRDVAIKVLPPAFSADAERRARFEREAQTWPRSPIPTSSASSTRALRKPDLRRHGTAGRRDAAPAA